jgi:gluconokinase
MPQRPLIVVMGVSGSGKSTIGARLARRLGLRFLDADDLHPITNVDKMTAGVPLTDDDRWPWLARVGEAMAEASGTGVVVACSALKRSYRDAIRAAAPEAVFVHLDGSRDLLAARLGEREDHFMPAALLDSQLDALEPLGEGERGIRIGIDHSAENIVGTLEREFA